MSLGIVHGSNGSSCISYLHVSSTVEPGSVILEPKLCECCGTNFYRPVQVALAPGPKTCRHCLQKRAPDA